MQLVTFMNVCVLFIPSLTSSSPQQFISGLVRVLLSLYGSVPARSQHAELSSLCGGRAAESYQTGRAALVHPHIPTLHIPQTVDELTQLRAARAVRACVWVRVFVLTCLCAGVLACLRARTRPSGYS